MNDSKQIENEIILALLNKSTLVRFIHNRCISMGHNTYYFSNEDLEDNILLSNFDVKYTKEKIDIKYYYINKDFINELTLHKTQTYLLYKPLLNRRLLLNDKTIFISRDGYFFEFKHHEKIDENIIDFEIIIKRRLILPNLKILKLKYNDKFVFLKLYDYFKIEFPMLD